MRARAKVEGWRSHHLPFTPPPSPFRRGPCRRGSRCCCSSPPLWLWPAWYRPTLAPPPILTPPPPHNHAAVRQQPNPFQPAPGQAPVAVGAEFIPTHEWQEIAPGQSIPPGLWVRVDRSTGKKTVRLIGSELEEAASTAPAAGVALVEGAAERADGHDKNHGDESLPSRTTRRRHTTTTT